jgi:hypothetical protein
MLQSWERRKTLAYFDGEKKPKGRRPLGRLTCGWMMLLK